MDALTHLLSAYFHQDWDLDGGTPSDTVAAYLREPAEVTRRCADEIDQLLAEDLDEGDLRKRLLDLGSEYPAGDNDADYRQWLIEVRDQIRAG